MFCMHFLTEEKIGREVANYGAAGGKPQVVWANGVTAVTKRQIMIRVRALLIGVSPFLIAGNSGAISALCREFVCSTMDCVRNATELFPYS